MGWLGSVITSIVTAAVITGLLGSVCQDQKGPGTLIRMICGLFLTVHLIQPFGQLDFEVLSTFAEEYTGSGEAAADLGKKISADAMGTFIKAETEAYILDKATEYGAKLTVDVTLSDADIPVPESVRIQGALSPYARSKLQQIMEVELGIDKERQIWIG